MNHPHRTSVLVASAVAVFGLVVASCGGTDADDVRPATVTAGDRQQDRDAQDEGRGEGEQAGRSFAGPLDVVVANSPDTLSTGGEQRVMTALLGDGPNAFLGGPDQPVTVRFASVEGETVGEVDGTWLTTNAAALGVYVTYYSFDAPGLWEVIVTSEGDELGQALVNVVETTNQPNIGDPAPASDSPTGTTDEEIAAISTDPDPVAGFYDLSIADAVANGRPTVIAFATPAFCQTALCGPTLESVKAATEGRDDLDVVHVEPYELEKATRGDFTPVPTMEEWGLATEPWVFVIDADGTVAATFEGIMSTEELRAAIDRL
jgi:hypothetical protein